MPFLDPLTEFGIGATTGLLDCCAFHWIDTLKVRRQDNRPLLMDVRTGKALPSPVGIGAATASLYAGFSTNLSLKLPYMASMFALNSLNASLLTALDAAGSLSTTAREFASAALVGVEVSLMLAPLEMVRIQGQNCGKGGLLSASRAVAATARGGGVLGWWLAWTRGMTATMHRETKYCIGQFFLCGKISEAIAQRDGDGAAEPSLVSQVAGAVLGGIACTVVSHPDDVIKTRMQTHLKGAAEYSSYPTYAASGLRVWRHEGLGALYNGAAFRCLLRVPLGLSLIIVSGEAIRAALTERRRSSQQAQ